MGAFDTFKYLLYTLRILRELEPSILVSLSLFSYATALWKARAGDSYTFSSLLPQRSLDLEKSAWHFAITKGETDPVTGEAWWQDVDAIDVYPNSAVYSGLSEWPTPKETWLDSSTDDLWCISYSAAASTHVPYGPIRSRDGTCGALPAQVTDWCNGWDTSMHVAGLDTFPTADAGWRCLTPDNWPPTHEGRCYAMCIDVVGDELHTPPHQSPDVFLFLSLPIMFDLYFILTWIHHKQLFKAFYGRLPLCRKLLFLLLSLCLVGAGTALSIFTPRVIGVYSQYDYPGPIAWIVICFGWAIYFFNLALEDDCKYIRYAMTPWIRLNMWMVGVKTVGDSGCKHPLDSDTALCFFLAKVRCPSPPECWARAVGLRRRWVCGGGGLSPSPTPGAIACPLRVVHPMCLLRRDTSRASITSSGWRWPCSSSSSSSSSHSSRERPAGLASTQSTTATSSSQDRSLW